MDFGLIGGVNPPDPKAGGPMSFERFEPARFAMGDTVRYAERVGLVDMEPRADLSSTRFTLANPGVEYLALQPERGDFTSPSSRANTRSNGSGSTAERRSSPRT
jgi:hypothetical protein